jgi:hypothetical protein
MSEDTSLRKGVIHINGIFALWEVGEG